jgi:hypothetical protein
MDIGLGWMPARLLIFRVPPIDSPNVLFHNPNPPEAGAPN